jgi:hypothetical protein
MKSEFFEGTATGHLHRRNIKKLLTDKISIRSGLPLSRFMAMLLA